jgi:hypothetical protein
VGEWQRLMLIDLCQWSGFALGVYLKIVYAPRKTAHGNEPQTIERFKSECGAGVTRNCEANSRGIG